MTETQEYYWTVLDAEVEEQLREVERLEAQMCCVREHIKALKKAINIFTDIFDDETTIEPFSILANDEESNERTYPQYHSPV